MLWDGALSQRTNPSMLAGGMRAPPAERIDGMLKHEADTLRKLVKLVERESKTPAGRALITSLMSAIQHFEEAESAD